MTNTLQLLSLDLTQLQRGQYQPRRNFDPSTLEELANSIKEQGVIEPLIVRSIANGKYEIIAGERRWRASQLAGLNSVPCILRECSDQEAAEVTLIENIQREDLNPIEEAQALYRLTNDFGYTHEEMAIAIGRSRAKITNALRLLQLDSRVQQLLIEKKLSEGHGKMLAGLSALLQYELAIKCIDNAWSVRKLEATIQTKKNKADNKVDANHKYLERTVGDRFNTEVKLENNDNQKSGWLMIKYYDYETLQGILAKMGVDAELD